MPAPTSHTTRALCACVEALGRPTCAEVAACFPALSIGIVRVYLARAARRGMLRMDTEAQPFRVSVLAGWQAKAAPSTTSRRARQQARQPAAPAAPRAAPTRATLPHRWF
jgi:hypothetical protein